MPICNGYVNRAQLQQADCKKSPLRMQIRPTYEPRDSRSLSLCRRSHPRRNHPRQRHAPDYCIQASSKA